MEYAIDFGTSNTVVARINDNGEIETVKLAYSSLISDNPPLIPSFVYVQDAINEQVLIGQEVCDRGLDRQSNKSTKGEQRFFKAFKRAIASNVSVFVPEIDGCEVGFELVGEWFLKKIIENLPDVDSLIFTVPVDSFESYRNWLGGVCEKLTVNQVRLLDEPTAAALGYGINGGEETLLVIDFGGGTLDLSLVKLSQTEANQPKSPLGFLLKWGDRTIKNSPQNPSKNSANNTQLAKVLAKTGQNLGGIDIDNWIIDYFHKALGLPKNSLVTRLAERIKIALSTAESTTEVYFNDETFESYELILTRSQLNQILEQQKFFVNLDIALGQIRQQAIRQNISLENIEAVLLVGGTSQIPAVKEWALRHFPIEKVKAHKPFEAIAHGAVSQGWELKDFLYHSYGVRYWDKRRKQHNWHTIVKSGETYPLPKPIELTLGASIPDQPSIELVIGELGETNVEVYFEGDRLKTRALDNQQVAVHILNEHSKAIAQLDPLGQTGCDRIKVLFQVDQTRILRITVQDLLTKQNLLEDIPVVQLI